MARSNGNMPRDAWKVQLNKMVNQYERLLPCESNSDSLYKIYDRISLLGKMKLNSDQAKLSPVPEGEDSIPNQVGAVNCHL